MSEKKRALKQAREALAAKEWREVLSACKAVLKEDHSSYEAFVYVGKAAYHLGEFEQAEQSYTRATEVNDKAAQAWQGLSELYHDTQQWAKAADADQVLVDLAHRGDAALAAKLPALVRRLGLAHVAAGQLEEAEVALRDVLAHPMPQEERLPVLALLADVQLQEDSAELDAKVQQRLEEELKAAGGDASKVCEEAVRSAVLSEAADEALELDCDHATPTLKEIVCSVAPTPPYAKYHDTFLRRLRRAVNVAAPGSMDRHNRRVAVLEVCRVMIEGVCAARPHVGSGCSSPYAYETALRLLEIEEEIAGAALPRTASQEFRGGGRASLASMSGFASPRSGFATPTAGGLPAAAVSPGSFFGSSSLLAARGGSLSAHDLGGAAAAAATPSGATPSGATPSGASLAGSAAGLLAQAPPTPRRELSSAQLSELLHHPMAGAAAAAGGTMAEAEREALSQLAAEASTGALGGGGGGGGIAAAAAAAAATANGTPGGAASPVGSPGARGGGSAAPLLPHANPLSLSSSLCAGGPGGLSLSLASAGGMVSRYSSAELAALASASPRLGGAQPHGLPLGPGTPRAHGVPPAAPLLLADAELIGRKLAHSFPWNPSARVHLAMALRRREAYMASSAAQIKLSCAGQGPHFTDLSCAPLAQRLRADRQRQLARRAWLADLLAKGLAAGAPVVSGMIGLAELRLEAGDAEGALEAAKRGLKFVFDRSRIGKERARHAALMLNLLAAQALLEGGQLTDAGRIFVRLAARVSEGEVSFGSEAVGMPPTSIRQQAIRGLAQVALAQGDTCQALHHYGELVSKALMGRGSAEHWAYAEYGWLLFQEGNADAGRYQLETALEVLYRTTAGAGGPSTAVAASYHYKLGRIYWALGGTYKGEREYCHAQLLEAAAEEGPEQARAFEWLGHWYAEVAGDEARARRCYQRALALDPALEGAGNALCDLLQQCAAPAAPGGAAAASAASAPPGAAQAQAQALELERQLLAETLDRAPDAAWARCRLARLQLQAGEYEAAVGSYQAAIRSSPKAPELWEGLGAAYRALGRHASALKALGRALELDAARPFALMSSGELEYMAGAYDAAAGSYRAALELAPGHPAALLGLAEALLSSASRHAAMGAAGAAALELREAAQRAAEAAAGAAAAGEPAAGPSPPAAAEACQARPEFAEAMRLRSSEAARRRQEHEPRRRRAHAGADADAGLPRGGNLVTAWKLLGDIHLERHLLQPAAASAAPSDARSPPDGAVAAAQRHLAEQRAELARARRAYARALHLCPSAGELWGDVALTYSHEARLMQQLQPPGAALAGAGATPSIAAARRAAVASARGGLRLAPASSWLWGVLAGAAAAAGDPAAAEYAYGRALALDPKAAALWVQLGRLYSRHGSGELAEQCFEAARGVEPTLVAVWEGMAAAAAAGGTAAGAEAAAAAAEHAVGLGGGLESWLEFATAGLRGGDRDEPPPGARGAQAAHDSGLLLACACKASAHQPLLLPPHAALAAALEARGQYAPAAAALRYCLALLQAAQSQGPGALAALGLGLAGLAHGFGQATHRVLLLPPAGCEGGGSEGVATPDAVAASLRLALARNLALCGCAEEALALFGELEASGVLGQGQLGADTSSWIAYGCAAREAGQAALAARVLERAVSGAASDPQRLRAAAALLQHRIDRGELEEAFGLCLQHLAPLSSANPGLAQACSKAWLSLVVAAAVAGQHDLQEQAADVMRQCLLEAQAQHIDTAWLECELACVRAAVLAAGGRKSAAVRRLAHAVHACPWHAPARLRLSSLGLDLNPRMAEALYRSCPCLLPEDNSATASSSSLPLPLPGPAARRPPAAGGAFSERLAEQEVLAAASSRATALSGQVAAAVYAMAGQEVARLQRLLHAMPGSVDLWYCLALTALLRAVGDGQCGHFRAARKCCLAALALVDRLIQQRRPAGGAPAAAAAAGGAASRTPLSVCAPGAADGGAAAAAGRSLRACSLEQLLEVRVRLMVAASECFLHSRQPGCHESAHQWAMDALSAALAAGGVGTATAHRQVGRMLATEGMAGQAEMAYRQAVTASGGGAAGAVLELAKLLGGQGRQQEAAGLLHGIWQDVATAVAAAAAADEGGGGGRATAAAPAAPLLGPGPHFVEAAALEEALLLADLGQLDAAREAAAAGLRLAAAAGESAPAAAELVTATVALQAAAAAPPERSRGLVVEARWAASSAAKSGLALPGTVGTAAAGVGAAVLAQVELARGKPDKAYDAIGMSFSAWVDQAVPPAVLLAAGGLTGQVSDCAAAVHTAPWLREGWERLHVAAAAGR